jgi:hypothetical protein
VAYESMLYTALRTANEPRISQEEKTQDLVLSMLPVFSGLQGVLVTEALIQQQIATPDGSTTPPSPTQVQVPPFTNRFLEDDLVRSSIKIAEDQGVRFEFKDATGTDVKRDVGKITGQNPPGNATVNAGDTVTLTIDPNDKLPPTQVFVPDLTQRFLVKETKDVIGDLESQGVKFEFKDKNDIAVGSSFGKITGQNPPGNATVNAGDTVTLTIDPNDIGPIP